MILCPLCGDPFPSEALVCPNDQTPRPETAGDEREEMVVEPTHVNVRQPKNGNKSFTVEPGTVIGEYVLEEKIGEGGMGEIWRGSQPLIGKQVAVKILRRKVAEDKEAIGRFIQEAKVVNSIKHKGLIDIFSFGDLPDNRPYFVMEFLEGRSLSSYLTENGPINWPEMLDILTQTCGALGAAHQRGVIHRDLKSENLFILFENGKPATVKLLDFGIAKLVSPDEENAVLTQAGDIFGTPAYMAPEQCQGNVSLQSDIYSLGIIWFEMITGRTPFYEPGEKVANVLVRQISEQAPPPSALVDGRDVPEEIDEIVLRVLSKNPDERPRSCGELAKIIRSVLGPIADDADTHSAAKPIYLPTEKRKRIQPQAQKSSAVVWLLALFTLIFAGAVVFFIVSAQPNTNNNTTPATQIQAVASNPQTNAAPNAGNPAPIKKEKHTLSITTSPKKAQVFQGARLLGNTPFTQEFEHSDSPLELIVSKEGYTPETISYTPNANSSFEKLLSKEGKSSGRNEDKKPKNNDPVKENPPKNPDTKPPVIDDPDALAPLNLGGKKKP